MGELVYAGIAILGAFYFLSVVVSSTSRFRVLEGQLKELEASNKVLLGKAGTWDTTLDPEILSRLEGTIIALRKKQREASKGLARLRSATLKEVKFTMDRRQVLHDRVSSLYEMHNALREDNDLLFMRDTELKEQLDLVCRTEVNHIDEIKGLHEDVAVLYGIAPSSLTPVFEPEAPVAEPVAEPVDLTEVKANERFADLELPSEEEVQKLRVLRRIEEEKTRKRDASLASQSTPYVAPSVVIEENPNQLDALELGGMLRSLGAREPKNEVPS